MLDREREAARSRGCGATRRAERPTPAYLVQDGDGWREVSWAEAAERVDGYANGLLALGVRKGDAFAILGSTRIEWALFDFALGLDRRDRGADLRQQLGEGRRLHPRPLGVDRRALRGRDAAREGGARSATGSRASQHVLTFADLDGLAARGRAYAAEHPDALREAADAIDENDLFTLHLHVRHDRPAEGLHDLAPQLLRDGRASSTTCRAFTGPEDTMLLYLPLAHNFGRLMHLSGAYVGYAIAFLPDPLQAAAALTAVRPTVFPSVPRVYEKIHTAVVAQVRRGDRRAAAS